MSDLLLFISGFIAGSYLMKKYTDKYWIMRIKKGQVPSTENAKYWNP